MNAPNEPCLFSSFKVQVHCISLIKLSFATLFFNSFIIKHLKIMFKVLEVFKSLVVN
jgi:hypothetical protein